MSRSDKLSKAIANLGKFYGINGRVEYMFYSVFGFPMAELNSSHGNFSDTPAKRLLEARGQANQSMTLLCNIVDDPLYIWEIVNKLVAAQENYADVLKAGHVESSEWALDDEIAEFQSNWDSMQERIPSMFNLVCGFKYITENPCATKAGDPKKEVMEGKLSKAGVLPYSYDQVSEGFNPENEKSNINKGKPEKSTPGVGWFMIKSPNLNFGSNETSAVNLFMNAIPVLEWSRAGVYFDMKVITEGSPVDSLGRPQGLSLMRFLVGKSIISPTNDENISYPGSNISANWIMATGQPMGQEQNPMNTWVSLLGAVQGGHHHSLDPLEAAKTDAEAKGEPGISTAGMEIFTAPQTLVPANESYISFDQYGFGAFDPPSTSGTPSPVSQNVLDQLPGGKQSARSAPILDRFQPLLTIKSFDISVKGTGHSIITTKSAKCSMTLHDRSRLSEVADLVKPSLYANTEILVEYGWFHPDSFGNNDYGRLIDSLRTKEKYGVYNASYSFKSNGSIDISLTMVTKGSQELEWSEISVTPEVAPKWRAIEEIINSVKVAAKHSLSPMMADVQGVSTIAALSPTNVGDVFSGDSLKEINGLLHKLSKPGGSAEIKNLATLLKNLKSKVAGFKSTAGAVITAKEASLTPANFDGPSKVTGFVASATKGADPFFFYSTSEPPGYEAGAAKVGNYNVFNAAGTPPAVKFYRAGTTSSDWASFGKIVSVFVIEPLAGSGRYNEIQIFSYQFNYWSSYMREQNIASYPINIADFKKKFKKYREKYPQVSLARFLNWLNSTFISNMTSPAYGFDSLFTEKDGKVELSKLGKDPSVFESSKDKVLATAYGDKGDKKFKCPSLGFHVECVPHTNNVDDLKGEYSGNAATILRLHFFDKNCTTYEGYHAILKAQRDSEIGAIQGYVTGINKKKADNWEKELTSQLEAAVSAKLLDGPHAGPDDTQYFSIEGGTPAIKHYLKASMPYIEPGVQNSPIRNFDIKTHHNAKMATIHMIEASKNAGGSQGAPGEQDRGLPLRMQPASANMSMMGMPLLSYGQQFFVDMGTNTTIDNVYAVVGVDHKLAPGKFETSCKLVPIDAWGQYESFANTVNAAATKLDIISANSLDSLFAGLSAAEKAAFFGTMGGPLSMNSSGELTQPNPGFPVWAEPNNDPGYEAKIEGVELAPGESAFEEDEIEEETMEGLEEDPWE